MMAQQKQYVTNTIIIWAGAGVGTLFGGFGAGPGAVIGGAVGSIGSGIAGYFGGRKITETVCDWGTTPGVQVGGGN